MQPVTLTSSNAHIVIALLNRTFMGVPERKPNFCKSQSSALKYKYLYIMYYLKISFTYT